MLAIGSQSMPGVKGSKETWVDLLSWAAILHSHRDLQLEMVLMKGPGLEKALG